MLNEFQTLLKEFFSYLDKVEETDEGRVFHPNQFDSVRAMDGHRMQQILERLKDMANDKYPR